jgi:GNAT superfamily N-acetyltransferase
VYKPCRHIAPAPGRLDLRPVACADLGTVNAVVDSAVTTWGLPQRVLRLGLPSLRYTRTDLDHMTVHLAHCRQAATISDASFQDIHDARSAVAVVAWEPATAATGGDEAATTGRPALLLHGLYVVAHMQRAGLGRRLVEAAAEHARRGDFTELVVKAWRDALPFFLALGFSTADDDAAPPLHLRRPVA